jgi:hypothetical protein
MSLTATKIEAATSSLTPAERLHLEVACRIDAALALIARGDTESARELLLRARIWCD